MNELCMVNRFVLWVPCAIVHPSFIQIFWHYIHCSGHIVAGFDMSLWHTYNRIPAFDGWCKDNMPLRKNFFIHSLFNNFFIQHDPFILNAKRRKFLKLYDCNENRRDSTSQHTRNIVQHFCFEVHLKLMMKIGYILQLP